MTKILEKSRIDEIEDLHFKFTRLNFGRLILAVRLGELLNEQKKVFKGQKGAWTQFVKTNLTIKQRTVQYYMKYYKNRHRLKTPDGAFFSVHDAKELLTRKRQAKIPYIPIEPKPKRWRGLPIPFTGGKRLIFRAWIE